MPRTASRPMRIALLNTEDLRGGAARAAYRLHRSLLAAGVQSTLLVQVKHGDDACVAGSPSRLGNLLNALRPVLDMAPGLIFPRPDRKSIFYPGWLPNLIVDRVKATGADLAHLHWVSGGFVNVRSLRRLGMPLVWTLHDMWAFTGGCHYDGGCGRYDSGCGRCPVLGSGILHDPSWFGWRRKARAYQDLPLRVVAPSRWLGERARSSALLSRFPVRVIPNAIDADLFRPIDRRQARELLRLPEKERVILFGAMRATGDPRKGYRYLQPALKMFARSWRGEPTAAMILGSGEPTSSPDLGMPCRYLGTLSDDVSLALAYSAADVLVAPSTQENLSNMVMEALACGTPVVAFDIGGMPDMIEHRENGYLAQPFDPADLANGLQWVLEDRARHARLAERARAKVLEEFEMSKVAHRYLALYEEVLAGGSGISARA